MAGYPIPTNVTVDLQRRGAPFDSYGNGTGAYATVATYDAWLERSRHNEPQLDGSTDAADFLLLISGDAQLVDHDRVVAGTKTYDVVSTPTQRRRPGGYIHHTEGRLRPSLPDLQQLLQSTLNDQCTINRLTAPTFDSGTGALTPGTPTVIFTGPCRVEPRDAYQRDTDIVRDATTLQSYTAVIPSDVATIDDDDVFTVDQSDDPMLTGRTMRVVGVRMATEAAGRVLFLEDHLG